MSRVKEFFRHLIATTFWRMVFWWKRRTGWLDLNQVVTIWGTVKQMDANVGGVFDDGDISFDVEPDFDYLYLNLALGSRRTGADGSPPGTIHCEVTPWSDNKLRYLAMSLKPGDRVCVSGRWGFDGVHLGKPMWTEILAALVRHQPNMRQGWLEIHPVQYLAANGKAAGPYR